MGICAVLLQVIAAKRQVSLGNAFAVCIQAYDLQQSICRNNRTVSCSKVFGRIQSKGDIGKLIVSADTEFFAQFQRFLQTQFHLLAFVIYAGGCFCQVYLLARINQFYLLRVWIQHHAVGRLCLNNLILTQIQFLAGNSSAGTGSNGIYYIAFCSTQGTVRCINIFCCANFIGCAFQAADFINRLVKKIRSILICTI